MVDCSSRWKMDASMRAIGRKENQMDKEQLSGQMVGNLKENSLMACRMEEIYARPNYLLMKQFNLQLQSQQLIDQAVLFHSKDRTHNLKHLLT